MNNKQRFEKLFGNEEPFYNNYIFKRILFRIEFFKDEDRHLYCDGDANRIEVSYVDKFGNVQKKFFTIPQIITPSIVDEAIAEQAKIKQKIRRLTVDLYLLEILQSI